MNDQRMLISVPEAAARLGISASRAWEMTRAGTFPGVVRIGRSVRVSVDQLREWIDQQATKPAA